MFKKILVANRGEIAVHIICACRDLGIRTVAVYTPVDIGAMHVRLAEECAPLTTERGYQDHQEVLRIAQKTGVDAIHPGYGFLAEDPGFVHACEDAGITFIGPSSTTLSAVKDKIGALERVQSAGYTTVKYSSISLDESDMDTIHAEAEKVGYPLIVKSNSGGRGRGTRLVRTPDQLQKAVQRTVGDTRAIFHDQRIYLEHAILNAHYVEVQLLSDQHGNMVHLGERDTSIQRNSQKIIDEAPSPMLTNEQRERLWKTALEIAHLFDYQGVGTVEFVIDENGHFFFTEIKARIQVESPVTEMISGVDIVREQLRIAAGNPLSFTQANIRLHGWAMQCRINAEDPTKHFLPSPGKITFFRPPIGPHVRVDAYVTQGSTITEYFDPMLAKLTVWAEDRATCLQRMRRAVADFAIRGVQTNLPLIQHMLNDPDFARGHYTTEFAQRPLLQKTTESESLRNLAIAAAIDYVRRKNVTRTSQPEQLLRGWHRSSRRLPE
ncbi:MAG: ATP-grasp domain-containing protein [Chloroflexi bacterium AL-W]|nr:ATP-grasp domain-containing protein [Chloroflexi bacterium AL-W]